MANLTVARRWQLSSALQAFLFLGTLTDRKEVQMVYLQSRLQQLFRIRIGGVLPYLLISPAVLQTWQLHMTLNPSS